MNSSTSIMLLEDDPGKAEMIKGLLRDSGTVAIEHFRALPDAVERLDASSCDLFLLDMTDGTACGIDAYRIIHHSSPEVPILLLVGDEASSDATRAIREGADETLSLSNLNTPLLIKSIHHAIENRKRKDQVRRLLFTMEQIPASILMVDRLGNIDFVNSRFGELTGCKNHEIIGENINTLRVDIADSGLFRAVVECVREGKSLDGETVITARNGGKRWAHYSISPVKDAEDIVSHYVAAIEDITVLKKKEDEIRESEENFRALISNINEYVYSVTYKDQKPISSFHSPRCEEITGYRAEEFISDDRLWYSMIYDSDKKFVTDYIDRLHTTQTESSIEHRIIRKDGAVRWVSNTCTALRNTDGAMRGMFGFILDITERKEWVTQIKKLSKAVKQSPVSVIIADRDGRIEYVNPKYTETTGYSAEEVTGMYLASTGSDGKGNNKFDEILKRLSEGHDWQGELRNRKKNGEYYWEYASFTSIKNKKGEITHFVEVKEDITERKKAEEALMKSESALRKRNEAMEKDLRLAQTIQKALIPKKIPAIKDIRIDYRHIPMEKVGGDFFSVQALDDNTLSVFIGDVAGHGLSAALFLSLLKSATDRTMNSHGRHVDEYMSGLNHLLIEEMPSFFITAIYAVLTCDTETGFFTFRFSNGGHPYPIHYNAREDSFNQLRLGGTIVGMFEEAEYGISEIELSRGDRVFFFTDGIIEIENAEKEMIGFEERLVDIFRRAHAPDLNDMLDGIIDETNCFRGEVPIDDDILIIGIEI